MKYTDNIQELILLPIDMIGFIFYDKSPRYMNEIPDLSIIPPSINRVGVFVNESISSIKDIVKNYHLNYVQLHGEESSDFCKSLKDSGIKVIKAFPIKDKDDLHNTLSYEGYCNYFLFDTKTSVYGGSGNKFDWKVLSFYKGNTPFILSGGISNEDTLEIKKIKHPSFEGIDLNSKFEISPGLKDIQKLKKFIQTINS